MVAMFLSLTVGFLLACVILGWLLSWGIKVFCRKFLHKEISHFGCSWIGLAISMIICAIFAHFPPG